MIYIDMDGVLCRWNAKASVEDTYCPGYFLGREVEPAVLEMIEILAQAGYPVTILSSVYETGTAAQDKTTWLEQHGLSSIARIFVPYGKSKYAYVKDQRDNVLLDDFSRNLHGWESVGFTGIKFYNGINGTNGTWKGYSISHRMPADKMAVVVAAVQDSVRKADAETDRPR